MRPEDSERWKIAYSVADRLVSSNDAPLTGDQALPAERSKDQVHQRVVPGAFPAAPQSRPQMESAQEEQDITSARPSRTYADV